MDFVGPFKTCFLKNYGTLYAKDKIVLKFSKAAVDDIASKKKITLRVNNLLIDKVREERNGNLWS